jgi:hemerythrin superfamily protein
MNIYEALRSDHKKVHHLLDQLVASSEKDTTKWKHLVDKIRDELIPHSRAEEAVFYNAIREKDPSIILHAYGEHAMAETELRTLQAMKSIDVNWTALAKKLREDLLHHVKEEESKVFAAAKKIFTDEEALMVGKAFAQLKPAIKEQSLAGTTLDLIENLLPRRFAAGFRKNILNEHKKSA